MDSDRAVTISAPLVWISTAEVHLRCGIGALSSTPCAVALTPSWWAPNTRHYRNGVNEVEGSAPLPRAAAPILIILCEWSKVGVVVVRPPPRGDVQPMPRDSRGSVSGSGSPVECRDYGPCPRQPRP